MPDTFLTACTHFGHGNILKFEPENRPFANIQEHDEALVDNWNSVVGKHDKIFHLGDVAFNFDAYQNVISRLNGRKFLVLGNHDHLHPGTYGKHFEEVRGARKIERGVWLSHIPIHPDEFEWAKLNIHGHIHSRYATTVVDDTPDPRYINVCVEHWDLTPVSYDIIRAMRFSR